MRFFCFIMEVRGEKMSNSATVETALKTQKFSDGKYGVMIHFSYNGTDWNERVNNFDCDALARQLHEIGAAHLFFSVTQYDGYFCCPCQAYDDILAAAGIVSHCSRRDLINDLYEALSRYGIDLYVMFSGRGPEESELIQLFPRDDCNGVSEEFMLRWTSVMRDISLRYGQRIKGWWVNGCSAYLPEFEKRDSMVVRQMEQAMREGNPDTLVAFNRNIGVRGFFHGEDYTAGEINDLNELPVSRMVDGVQWHAVTYLGPYWGVDGCARKNREIIRFVKRATDMGGVVTLDVAVNYDGTLTGTHYNQMLTLRSFIRDRLTFSERDITESGDYIKFSIVEQPDEIPKNWVNIAYGKECRASSYYDWQEQTFPPEEALTDNMATGWAPAAKEEGDTYWEIDLGSDTVIDAIEYVPRKLFPYERRNFECIASLDPNFTAYITLLHHGNFPLPVGINPARILPRGVLCRYIRFRPTAPGTRVFITQLKIFKKP